MHAPPTSKLLAAIGLTTVVALTGCSADDAESNPDETSTGQASPIDAPTATTGEPPGSDGAPIPDLGNGPNWPVEMGPIDADGCFGECFADEDPLTGLVDPYCDVELHGDGDPIAIPECEGTSPDDYAPPAGSDACHWFAVDNEHWGLTPDDPRDDTADACQPNNASFKFVEAVDGVLATGELYASCGHRPDTIPMCCDAEDECDR